MQASLLRLADWLGMTQGSSLACTSDKLNVSTYAHVLIHTIQGRENSMLLLFSNRIAYMH